MRFETSQLLWLLLLVVPALAAFFLWSWRVRRRLMAQFVAARLLPQLTAGVSAGRLKARMALAGAALALLVVVLARPQLGYDWEEARTRGLDILVALDTSRSMLAADVAPNRLRRAQLAALDLRRLARTDRLGLVAFAGGAFLQCPLSLDDEAFRQSVEALDVNIIPQGGSSMAEAILTAMAAFKDKTDNHRVLVIFTDGEDHEGEAVEAARQAAKEGFLIYTVGVGTPAGELLRVTDTQGRADFIKDADGNVVKSRLNEALLREVAQAAGGFYVLLRGADTMEVLYERALAPLPKGEFSSRRLKRHHERYQWLLGLTLVLLLAEMLLPERKSAKPAAASSAEKNAAARAAALLLVLLTPTWAHGSAASAMKDFRRGNFAGAQLEYEALLRDKPHDPRLRYNAGTAAFQGANYDAALEHLQAALTNTALPLPLQQRAYYNLGGTRFRQGEAVEDLEGRLKQWEQALKSYQAAVALRTNDLDAAFNLQLVKDRMEEVRRILREREAARRARETAEMARRRREYGTALRIMQSAVQTNAAAKEFKDYTERLRQIDEIHTPRQP
jgi:Ca-activated chloride channel family protein